MPKYKNRHAHIMPKCVEPHIHTVGITQPKLVTIQHPIRKQLFYSVRFWTWRFQTVTFWTGELSNFSIIHWPTCLIRHFCGGPSGRVSMGRGRVRSGFLGWCSVGLDLTASACLRRRLKVSGHVRSWTWAVRIGLCRAASHWVLFLMLGLELPIRERTG